MKDNNKIIEGKITKERDKNKKNNFFTSKIFLTIVSFFIGAGLMYYFIAAGNNGNVLVRKVTSENVKTTTVEEISDLKNAINSVYESAVYIEVTGDRASSSGSGFVYKTDDNYGYILTNHHVINNGKKFVVTFSDGTESEASLVSSDEYYDIAVLKLSKDKVKKVATLGDSSNIELGDTVFTVGAPLGKEYMGTITKGIVSGINRMVSVSNNYLMEVIQTDASINSGNSGGPICNIKGEVIGITSSKLIGSGIEGMGFAIPINTVNEIITSIESGTTLERPYLGVQLVNLTNTFALQYYYNI